MASHLKYQIRIKGSGHNEAEGKSDLLHLNSQLTRGVNLRVVRVSVTTVLDAQE